MDPNVVETLNAMFTVLSDPEKHKAALDKLVAAEEHAHKLRDEAELRHREAEMHSSQGKAAHASATRKLVEAEAALAAAQRQKDAADLTNAGLEAKQVQAREAERAATEKWEQIKAAAKVSDEREAALVEKEKELTVKLREVDDKLAKIKQLAA